MKGFQAHVLLKELAILVRSGIPLTEALEFLALQDAGPRERLLELKRRIEEGEELVEAFKASGLFPEFVCEMVGAARTGGNLEDVLEKASQLLERSEEFGARLLGSLIYPSVVLVFALLAVLVAVKFVVPRLKSVLVSFGRDLPLPTKFMMWGAELSFWVILVGGPLTLVFGVFWARKKGREGVHEVLLRIPVVGKLWINFDLSGWSYVLAMLLESGVTLPKAVEVASESCRNAYIKSAIKGLVPELSMGYSLASLLKEVPLIPKILPEVISVGEESGTLSAMLKNASEVLFSEGERLVNYVLRWVEPALILFVGAIVAFLIVSVILPVVEISTSVSVK